MRTVIYSEYVKVKTDDPIPKIYSELQEMGQALFHRFGCDYEEFENGAVNYSTAIIELGDGQVKNIPAEQIRFIDEKHHNRETSL